MAASASWKRLITRLPVTRRVVARFIPGDTLDAALTAVAAINRAGMSATLNPLGENVANESEARSAAGTYAAILDEVASRRLDCNVSVKLTLLGLDLGEPIARRNLEIVLAAAARHDNFVRIDMESSAYVDPTLRLGRRLGNDPDRLGLVIQSYLRRSAADIDTLVAAGTPVRLVKGAYAEPASVAFPAKSEVDAAYTALLDRLARPDTRVRAVRVAVATHDPEMVRHARELIDAHGLDDWEFQMLYGIGTGLQEQLVRDGYRVRVYVSYGPSWYPWFMRRLAERPANLLFFLRHLLG